MSEPMVTVAVLAVLWLIVVIPMIVQRKDARAGSRSAARFTAAMRVLSRGGVIDRPAPMPMTDPSLPTLHTSGTVNRKPVPAVRESTMFTSDRADMSPARRRMMARRRRALTLLILGLLVAPIVAVMTGAVVAWICAAALAVALVGYLVSLHGQASRDDARRRNRRVGSLAPAPVAERAETSTLHRYTDRPEAVVSIDSDDVSLDHFDTIDLTGLYTDDDLRSGGAQDRGHDLRRAG